MKLYLPHREVDLDTNLPFEKRKEVISLILKEQTGLRDRQNEPMSVEEYFRFTWNDITTMVLMDIIGYYLTKDNINDSGEDREVLSNKKQKEMRKGSKRHTTFSGLPEELQNSIGLKDIKEEIYD